MPDWKKMYTTMLCGCSEAIDLLPDSIAVNAARDRLQQAINEAEALYVDNETT